MNIEQDPDLEHLSNFPGLKVADRTYTLIKTYTLTFSPDTPIMTFLETMEVLKRDGFQVDPMIGTAPTSLGLLIVKQEQNKDLSALAGVVP